MSKELSNSNIAVDVLSKTIETFTTHAEKSFEDVMAEGLRQIAEVANLDRIVIYNKIKTAEEQFGQFYRWDKAAGGTTHIDESLKILPDIPAVMQWFSASLKGEFVIRRLGKMSEDEKSFSKMFGIKAIAIVPIFTRGEYWGAIAFQDHAKERDFDDCIGLLSSVAHLCANAAIREEMQKENDRTIEILEALNKAAITFVSQSEESFEEKMTAGVRLICDTIGLDRVSIWRNFHAPDGLRTSQIYRWDRESGGTTKPTPGLDDVAYKKLAPRWEEILPKNEIANGPVKLMPEAAMLKSFGVVSALVVPLFIKNNFWGFALFEDRRRERYFEEHHVKIMRSAAFLCANIVIDAEMERKIVEANEKTRLMLDTIPISCQWWDKNMNVIDCNNAALKLFGLKDKQEFFDRFFQMMPERQPDGQNSKEKAVAYIEKAFEEGKCGFEWMHRLADGTLMEAEIYLERIKYGDSPVLVGYVRDLREHKKLMRGIEQANEFNRALVRAAPIGITIFDNTLKFFDCNDTILNAYGGSKEQFIKNFADFSPEYQEDGSKSADKIIEIMKRTLRGEQMVYEWTHRSAAGELIPFEVTTTRVKHNEQYIGLAFQYNLHNMRKIEAIASEAQEMARAITEASPISYILFDEGGNAIDCNEAALRTFAAPSKEFLLDNYWKIFVAETQPDGQDSFKKSRIALNQAFIQGRHSFEWICQTLGGELIPVENTFSPFVFKEKKFILSFNYDMRKQKKMMESIREQSEKISFRLEQQKLISEISKSFVSYGESYTLINEALNKLGNHIDVSRIFIFYMDYENCDTHAVYQWYADENTPKLQGDRSFDFFGIVKELFPKELPEGAPPIISCADVNASAEESFHIFKSAGVTSFIGVPLYVEGNLWGVISAEHCFAPHEWPEDETSFFATISSIIAGAIMRSIYDTRLKETLHKMTNLSKAKDDFLSKISHEIRTPMNAILGITEIQLQDETLPAGTRDGLSVIHNSGDSLLRIINDLLDLSKIEAKKIEIAPAKYEIASLISDSTQLNMMRIESKPIEFKLDIDENIPAELIGDELRIKQVLNNVLSNAFKYTNSGEVSMSILAEDSKSENFDVMLTFKVSDTGQGMTEEQTRKIFDEYFRFNLGSNNLVEGTGLGMTITRNLVQLMDGDISVESELGKGSVFTIHLPQKTAGAEVLGREVAENLQKFRISNSSQLKKMQIVRDPMPYGKVLIVDDVESNLYVAKRILAPYDLSLETAMSGFEAIDKIKSGKVYDIVFMDHMMPKMDGIEAVRIMRELGYARAIVALTANAVVGQAEIFLNNGFDGFISKPIDFIQLDNALNKFIRDKQLPKAMEKTEAMPAADAELLSIFARDAKKSIPVFEEALKNIASIAGEDLRLFTVHAHAMKSALANIGENALSRIALNLEKAGKEKNAGAIAKETQKFISSLKEIVAKAEKEEHFAAQDENPAYLREQLKTIGEACINYDARTANAALIKLGEMLWTNETKSVIEQISKHVLFSEFEEANALAADYGGKV